MYESTTVVVPAFVAHVEFAQPGAGADDNEGGSMHPLRAKYTARDPAADGEASSAAAAAAESESASDAFQRKRRLTASARKGYAAKKMRGALGAAVGLDSRSAVDGLASGGTWMHEASATVHLVSQPAARAGAQGLRVVVYRDGMVRGASGQPLRNRRSDRTKHVNALLQKLPRAIAADVADGLRPPAGNFRDPTKHVGKQLRNSRILWVLRLRRESPTAVTTRLTASFQS